MRSQKIMLWGWFGFENLGDDLLLDTMIRALNSPRRTITVPMRTPYVIEQTDIKQVSRSYKELLKGALYNDVLIIGPGGLFPFDNPQKVWIYFIIVLLWKLGGRKVAFFGIGISKQLSSMSRHLWKAIAIFSDLFITRSPGVIENIGLIETSKIHTMADTVFASNMEFTGHEHSNKIGIFVANLKQPGMEKAYKVFVETWQEIISDLLDRGFLIDLIAFTKYTDDQLIADIAGAFSSGGVRTARYEISLDEIKRLPGYKITLSMRFHALVLSLLAGVPSIPIAYGQKTYSLATQSGLSEYTLIWNAFQKEYYGYVKELSATDVVQKIDLMMSNYDDVKAEIVARTEKLKTSARTAMNQLLELIS